MAHLAQFGKSNMHLASHPNGVVLVSYETPVAAIIGGACYKTSTWYSATTTKHVNGWLPEPGTPVGQDQINAWYSECL